MRPISLSIQAFGPYAGRLELDFRQLAGHSLFLIHGPTGSGKTTILDAMCFALFGEAAGTDRRGKDARSHFADPSVATEVTLVFSLGEDVWRVRRVAEQMRPGGVTMKPPQAVLERILKNGEPELRGSRVREVDAAVSDLLGFEVEQFRQVVLLPQGEFRRLLLSDSKDREKILESLFGAELYRRIEAELKRSSAALEREVADGRTRIDELLRLCGATGIEEVRQRLQAQQVRKAELDVQCEDLRQRSLAVSGALAQAGRVAAAHAEHGAALRELEALEKDVPLQLRRREALAAARRAQALEAPLERVSSANAAVEKEQRRLATAVRAREEAGREVAGAAAALALEEQRGAEREDLAKLVRTLEQARESAGRLAQARASMKKSETALADATGAARLNERDIAYALGRIDAQDKELSLLRPVVADVERRRARVAELGRVAKTVNELAAARSFLLRQSVEVGGAAQRVAACEVEVARCAAAESDLLRGWSDGQAALLASRLSGGQPCPVCGSPEHPAPAQSTERVPSQGDLDSARASLASARAAVDAARVELDNEKSKETELRRTVAIFEGALGQDASWSPQEAADVLARAEIELVEAGKAHARVFELETDRKAQQRAIEEATADRELARARLSEENARLAAARTLEAELARSLPGELATADVSAMHAGALRRANAMSQAFEQARTRNAEAAAAFSAAGATFRGAGESAAEAAAAAEAARATLSEALARGGFATQAELESARLSAVEMDALEAVIARFDAAIESARDRLRRAAAAVEGADMPDLAALRAGDEAARRALEQALDEKGRLDEALDAIGRTLQVVGELETTIGQAERRFRAVGKVAAVAEGRNEAGMSFARYVLGTLLEEVLAAATERLLRMSQGRFALVRAGDRRDRRRSGGLDLEVFDAHTGIARPVATLSGGESFLASLSLALGLADIVQAHTGGIHLETMFVDEGFGTLDPEALDLAMRALEDLRQGGRLVGIISHVPELKERIGARLEVVAGQRGSTARFAC